MRKKYKKYEIPVLLDEDTKALIRSLGIEEVAMALGFSEKYLSDLVEPGKPSKISASNLRVIEELRLMWD